MDAIEELIEKIKQQQATITAQVEELSARIHKVNPINREHRGK
jgi:predicted GTPase